MKFGDRVDHYFYPQKTSGLDKATEPMPEMCNILNDWIYVLIWDNNFLS